MGSRVHDVLPALVVDRVPQSLRDERRKFRYRTLTLVRHERSDDLLARDMGPGRGLCSDGIGTSSAPAASVSVGVARGRLVLSMQGFPRRR